MLILIRHGSYSIRDGSLDELGIAQAKAIGDYLSGQVKPTVIFHSPAQRTTEMARIIADRLHVQTEVDLSLAETSNPLSYGPPFLDNTYTIAVTHLPTIRNIFRLWAIHWNIVPPVEIPIASVFLIDRTTQSIQKLSD
ncbi:MAG: histidine phosphatase family protein [Candidatus Magasanikbacteria bacterium]|nr:histidine phosphatase family protein [Candidatus Magasanikbacteria bacterium]MCA9389185.1 histidine phosphatase family protein [Candidatus Magasanikbacteria bacterium]MCA9390971.1 histidine phosphatase family protein [Candidatus Magasanikbacteria bacterium]USN52125.1 MAG: histidine phosphatase family protein [Candidatus Nomurabacteria bacterium]HPF95034.1 histidine phosphatase family protein [bacterium]